jgi:hypothetical protein
MVDNGRSPKPFLSLGATERQLASKVFVGEEHQQRRKKSLTIKFMKIFFTICLFTIHILII